MNISVQVGLWAIGTLIAVGVVYGDLRARLASIEKKLGTNGDGVFIRKSEIGLLRDIADREHERMWDAIKELTPRG